jgi:chromosome segregation ATPase
MGRRGVGWGGVMRETQRRAGPDTEQERLRRQQRSLLGALKTANAERADLEWTLAELEQQIATLAAEQASLRDSTVQRRLADLRRWRGTLEERVLQHMFRAEELEAELVQLRERLGKL